MREAVVLVGGRGTRLRPLTVDTPKPLLPTAGVPFVHHLLCKVRDAGVGHVVLATSFRPEVFEKDIGDGSQLGLRVSYVVEAEPLGTGGAIRNAAACLVSGPDDPVVILNGDVLSGHDIAAQVAVHVEAGAAVTLHLTEVDDARAFGCVPTAADGRVTAFVEKSPEPVTNRVNAGCYVFARRVIDDIPAARPVSVERETFPALLDSGAPVLGHVQPAYWLDLGTPATYVRGSADLVLGRLDSAALPGPAGESLVLPGGQVSGDAVVGGGTTIGAGAVVATGATVEGSVLMDGAVVGAGSVVRSSVLGRDAVVGERVVLDEAVLGDRSHVGDGNELRAGLRVWPDVRLGPGTVRFSSDEPPG